MPSHIVNICAKFHSNLSTEYRDVVSCELGVNRQTTDKQPDDSGTLCLSLNVVGNEGIKIRSKRIK